MKQEACDLSRVVHDSIGMIQGQELIKTPVLKLLLVDIIISFLVGGTLGFVVGFRIGLKIDDTLN